MSEFRYYRPSNFPPVVKNLIIINVLVFLAQIAFENQYHLSDKLALAPVDTPDFHPYQIFTHMFAHSTEMYAHILFNMFALWMFGRILENVWGPKRFLFFYLASGIGAAACHLLVQHLRYDPVIVRQLEIAISMHDQDTINALRPHAGFLASALGASGAIMGLFAAFAYLFPNTELIFLFIPFPIKAKWMVLIMVGLDLFGGISNVTGDNVAHFAHLGGAITGFIIVLIWNKTNRRTLY